MDGGEGETHKLLLSLQTFEIIEAADPSRGGAGGGATVDGRPDQIRAIHLVLIPP